jgi:uncharacterized protein (UPF0261 family)
MKVVAMQETSRILIIGAFDTKANEYVFLRDMIVYLGGQVVTVNTGILSSTDLFPIDIEADEVARAGGGDLDSLRVNKDRGRAMAVMAAGAAAIVRRLHDEGRVAGIIGMGGSGGSSVVTAAMRALPVGVPKVCVSTVAGGDTAPYVGLKDVTLIPSITDVAGLNRISRIILTRAAGAIVGMVNTSVAEADDDRPIIAASMFGNTTQCVDRCRELLDAAGYEVLVFHATGTGGRMMESLIDEGLVDACLDITTTEWADTVCGGVFDAGEDRLSAAGRRGIPHLIVPGCIDMANFGPIATVPQIYRDAGRKLYEWNPSVTLMRTNVEENRRMGEVFAEKANAAKGPVAIMIPLKGVSILDGDGQQFCDRDADQAMFDALKENLRPGIQVVDIDANINDTAFADKAVEIMLALIKAN